MRALTRLVRVFWPPRVRFPAMEQYERFTQAMSRSWPS